MTATIETPFLPIFDERNACYRAVIEVTDADTIHQYYCSLDLSQAPTGRDIYEGLKGQALFQHKVLHTPEPILEKLAA